MNTLRSAFHQTHIHEKATRWLSLYRGLIFTRMLQASLLSGLWLWVGAASASTQGASSVWESKPFNTCETHLPMQDKRYIAGEIQSQLSALYQNNAEFQPLHKKSPYSFNDGIFGARTHQWLAYFCAEFALLPASTARSGDNIDHDVAPSVLSYLQRASQLNARFPKWRQHIQPEQLLFLSDQDIHARLTPSPPPATPAPALFSPPSYYQLTEQNISQFKLRQQTWEIITESLLYQRFEQRSQLYNTLQIAFSTLGVDPDDPRLNIDGLIQSKTIDLETTSSDVTPIPPSEKSVVSSTDGNEAQKTASTTQIPPQAIAPPRVWQLNPKAVANTLASLNITPIPVDVLTKLEPLQNDVFASRYLMNMALELADISPASAIGQSILASAKKMGSPPQVNISMNWRAPENTGCQDGKPSLFSNELFYGFYPYWLHPEEGQEINFSQLDRIGYVAAVMQLTANGSQLILPPGWTTHAKASDFIQTAHRYRTQVDLVVTVPETLSSSQLTALFTQPHLIEQLVGSISQPLDQRLSNRIKPWLSFGMSPIPSLGDGLTFDVDLSALKTKESQRVFLDFARKLKLALNHQAGHFSEEADKDDRYYLNFMIPIPHVLDKSPDNFYQFDMLFQLAKITNFLIMRPDATQNNTLSTQSIAEKSAKELKQLQGLQAWLTTQLDQGKTARIHKEMLPMLVTPNTRDTQFILNQAVGLASWSSLGAAYWPLPLNSLSKGIIGETYFPPAPELPAPLESMRSLVTQVFDWVCPNRWPLRVGLLVSFLVIFSVLLTSCVYYPLRCTVVSKPFVLFSVLSMMLMMLVFIADPYFKHYQVLFLLASMVMIGVILMAVRWVTKDGDKP